MWVPIVATSHRELIAAGFIEIGGRQFDRGGHVKWKHRRAPRRHLTRAQALEIELAVRRRLRVLSPVRHASPLGVGVTLAQRPIAATLSDADLVKGMKLDTPLLRLGLRARAPGILAAYEPVPRSAALALRLLDLVGPIHQLKHS
jgi:hypothetical protein